MTPDSLIADAARDDPEAPGASGGGTKPRRRGFANETWEPKTYEWYTPPWVFDALGLTFDLDAASPGLDVVPWVPAARCYTRHEDGLAQPWAGRVWLNPPYGDLVPRFMGRMADHGDGVALVLSRTDTRWFHTAARAASAVCFMPGRLDHVPGEGAKPSRPQVGSVLFAYGDECARALAASGLGVVMRPDVQPAVQLDIASAA